MAYRADWENKRAFGIELEGFGLPREAVVDALKLKKVSSKIGDGFSRENSEWVVASDGTVKNTYPIEIISPILVGEKSFPEIKRVCDTATAIGLKVDESCGFHVHWNIADYTGRSMINLLRLYAKYEKTLDFIFPPYRRENNNQFAYSLLKGESGSEWIYGLNAPYYFHAYEIAQEFEATQGTANTSSYPTARHHKINVCAYNKYRTVEFRQHQGTFDYEEVREWIILTQQMVSRAKDTLVFEGVATWDSFMKTLALTEPQLNEWMDAPSKVALRAAREFYKKIYKENKGEKSYATVMG